MLAGDHLLVDAGEDKAVGVNRAQFLHHIQCEAGAPGAGTVQKAHIRVQTHPFQRGGAVPRQQSVGKGEQGVDGVERRTAVAPGKGKGVMLLQNQAVEAVKVLLRSCTLQTAQLFQGDCVLDVWQGSGKVLGEGF